MLKEFEAIKRSTSDAVPRAFLDAVNYLITEKGQNYSELFGEEIEVEFKNKFWKKLFGKITIKRKGIPLSSLMSMIKFVEKLAKEEQRKLKSMKRPSTRR